MSTEHRVWPVSRLVLYSSPICFPHCVIPLPTRFIGNAPGFVKSTFTAVLQYTVQYSALRVVTMCAEVSQAMDDPSAPIP